MTAGRASRADLPGLSAQRTVLAWDRTALALLGNAALVLVRDLRGVGAVAFVPAAVAVLAALTVAVLGRWRARVLGGDGPLPAAAAALTVVGGLVAVFGVTVLLTLVVVGP